MPLFVVRGRMARSLLDDLGNGGTAAAHERSLAAIAAAFGGTLAGCHAVAGSWDVLALFDLSIDAATHIMAAIQTAGVFEPGQLRLAMALDAAGLDALFAAAATIGTPWGELG